MRFVTWNMGRSRNTHKAAWHYLLKCLNADLACVQEALGSADQFSAAEGSIAWGKARSGGTGVFVRHGVRATPVPSTINGAYVASVVVSARQRSVRVFSVHVGPESWKNQEAFGPWVINQVHAEPSLIGGDINTSRGYSAKHKAYLEGLVKSGVHDCHWDKNNREVPSFWGRQSQGAKYQDDHFFASEGLANAVKDCWVDDNPLTRMLSDHGPVVLDLDLEGPAN